MTVDLMKVTIGEKSEILYAVTPIDVVVAYRIIVIILCTHLIHTHTHTPGAAEANFGWSGRSISKRNGALVRREIFYIHYDDVIKTGSNVV